MKRGTGIPATFDARRIEHVDPGAVPLPVSKSGEATEVFSRGRGRIGVDARCEPALCDGPLTLFEAVLACHPQVTSSGRGGLDYERVVVPGDGERPTHIDVVEKHERPCRATGRAHVDLSASGILGSCPRDREPVETKRTMPDHRSRRSSDCEV
jgi:hypothetical protein